MLDDEQGGARLLVSEQSAAQGSEAQQGLLHEMSHHCHELQQGEARRQAGAEVHHAAATSTALLGAPVKRSAVLVQHASMQGLLGPKAAWQTVTADSAVHQLLMQARSTDEIDSAA